MEQKRAPKEVALANQERAAQQLTKIAYTIIGMVPVPLRITAKMSNRSLIVSFLAI